MNKICCIFVASLLVISMTIPMVFAGAQPQQTDSVTEETSSVLPDRAISNTYFIQSSGSVTIDGNTYTYDWVFNPSTLGSYSVRLSECPSKFAITPSSAKYLYISNDLTPCTVTLVTSAMNNEYYRDNVSWQSYSTYSLDRTFSNMLGTYTRANTTVIVEFHADPQQSALSPVYQLLLQSGVNEEWSSIGVVIFAMLPIVTIWIIIGRVFKRKER